MLHRSVAYGLAPCSSPQPAPLTPPPPVSCLVHTAELSDAATSELLNNIRLGAPLSDSVLVQLLSQWADKGRTAAPAPLSDGPISGPRKGVLTAVPDAGTLAPVQQQKLLGDSPEPESAASSSASLLREKRRVSQEEEGRLIRQEGRQEGGQQLLHPSSCELRLLRCPSDGGSGAGGGGSGAGDAGRGTVPLPAHPSPPSSPRSKRQKMADGVVDNDIAAAAANVSSSGRGGSGQPGFNPIDHIFQFHSALKQVRPDPWSPPSSPAFLIPNSPTANCQPAFLQELRELERDANHLEAVVREACAGSSGGADGSLLSGHSGISIPSGPLTPAGQGSCAVEALLSVPPASNTGALMMVPPAANALPSLSAAEAGARATAVAGAAVPWSALSQLPKSCISAVQQLTGRFQFLWGIYRAHSRRRVGRRGGCTDTHTHWRMPTLLSLSYPIHSAKCDVWARFFPLS